MIQKLISELVCYGMETGLVTEEDRIYVTNRLLELFEVIEYAAAEVQPRRVAEILGDMTKYALENGLIPDDTVTQRDLFDSKVMGILTPPPSVVRKEFKARYKISPEKATEYFFELSNATNYIRRDRIEKDEKWQTKTEYGTIDITINLSKPEKDPREIAKAGKAKQTGYPRCLLCKENEGYAGHLSHPARQNHRIIPVTLAGEQYYLQYSPYVYYNEHCIVFNEAHVPMKINKEVFVKLLDFVRQFPHYTVGSNADLPIVGGSILSHDHFQGGAYTFSMARAPYEYRLELTRFGDVAAGVVKWPMSVIRLQSSSTERLASAANQILEAWRVYTDEAAFIFSETDGVPHNTITPIARKNGELFEMDLVLRNNITTKDRPWGVYHPEEKLHHIKKENIGLIEVMGLAVLPARLQKEMRILADAIVEGKDLQEMKEIQKHAAWVDEWRGAYTITPENITEILRKEIANRFVQVLECAGVYKRTSQGREAFKRFLAVL